MISRSMHPLVTDHWFVVVAPIVVLVNALVATTGPIDRLVEFGLLFDLVLLLPALYLVCYRRRKRGAAIRAIALACLGVWAATKLVPEADRALLVYIEPLRYVGLAVLILLELAVVTLFYQSLLAGDTADAAAKKVTEAADTPEWVARVLAWEASLWQRLFSSVRRIFQRDRDDA